MHIFLHSEENGWVELMMIRTFQRHNVKELREEKRTCV